MPVHCPFQRHAHLILGTDLKPLWGVEQEKGEGAQSVGKFLPYSTYSHYSHDAGGWGRSRSDEHG